MVLRTAKYNKDCVTQQSRHNNNIALQIDINQFILYRKSYKSQKNTANDHNIIIIN